MFIAAAIDPNWLSWEPIDIWRSFFLGGMLVEELFESVARAEETPKGMLAAQIRSQEIACDKPKRAVRDAKRSKPDYDVWILTCENATRGSVAIPISLRKWSGFDSTGSTELRRLCALQTPAEYFPGSRG